MFNLLKRPIEVETLEAWAKLLEDMAKVALFALPVVVLGENSHIFKVVCSIGLCVVTYFSLIGGKQIRKNKSFLASED